jgi:WD40 repeat protein
VRRLATLLLFLAALALPASAQAAFPGRNGKIAFGTSKPNFGSALAAVQPDGSGNHTLTTGVLGIGAVAWSPDGKTVSFADREIEAVDADGSNRRFLSSSGYLGSWSADGKQLVTTAHDCFNENCRFDIKVENLDPTGVRTIATFNEDWVPLAAWSPDGSRIVFDSLTQLWTVRPDGSDLTPIPNTSRGGAPDWSPDGSRIAFGLGVSGNVDVYTIRPDGSGLVRLTTDAAVDSDPAWSPDGTKIAFTSNRMDPHPLTCLSCQTQIYVVNADGTTETRLTNEPIRAYSPAWQPIPVTGYPRPKGATPLSTSLALAYDQCPQGTGNRQHGPPLAVGSCAPPTPSSQYLTVGTLDSNGQQAKAVGLVRFDAKPGNLATPVDEADVKLEVSLKDVRNTDLSDYPGELQMQATRRITDKDNTPNPGGPGAGTTNDLLLAATVPCTTNSDATVGSTCALLTTADTLVPGQVKEGMRSIWQLADVKLYDGGADGQAATSDNTLFMHQGLFVP